MVAAWLERERRYRQRNRPRRTGYSCQPGVETPGAGGRPGRARVRIEQRGARARIDDQAGPLRYPSPGGLGPLVDLRPRLILVGDHSSRAAMRTAVDPRR